MTSREVLEDERRWALIFAALAGVVSLLVSVYDVDSDYTTTLLTVSAIAVGFYLARAANPAIPAWWAIPVAGLVQAGAVGIHYQAEGHTLLVILGLFYGYFREARHRRAALVATAVVLPMPFVQYITGSIDSDGWLFWTLGYLMCGWFGHLAFSLRSLAAELEVERAETAARAVHRERRQIARDVHDIVGHSLSVVLLHLTAARRTVTEAPGEAEASLRQAEEVGREAMAEIRHTMSLLADTDGDAGSAAARAERVGRTTDAGSPETPDNEPVPTLIDLEKLVERYRSAGLPISLRLAGDPSRLPIRAGVAGYRIVQEALVNATKHGSGRDVAVQVAIDDAQCRITVDNERAVGTRTAAPTSSAGLGLVGMRERARSVRGTLIAGPVDERNRERGAAGRWRVEAALPLVMASAGTVGSGVERDRDR